MRPTPTDNTAKRMHCRKGATRGGTNNTVQQMDTNLLEIARTCPGLSITVNADDLRAFGAALVSETMQQYRATVEAEIRAKNEDRLLTVYEAAKLLGVCTKTVYRIRKAGEIEAVPVGGQLRYRRSDCLAILSNRRPE